MSTQQQVFDLIKTLTEDAITIPRLFVRMFGLNTAYFLVLLFYMPDTHETFWATADASRALKDLEAAGIVVQANGRYRLGEQALIDAIFEHRKTEQEAPND